MVPAAHITMDCLPVLRCTAPITCASVGRVLEVGAAISVSVVRNQSLRAVKSGSAKRCPPRAAPIFSSATLASETNGCAARLAASKPWMLIDNSLRPGAENTVQEPVVKS